MRNKFIVTFACVAFIAFCLAYNKEEESSVAVFNYDLAVDEESAQAFEKQEEIVAEVQTQTNIAPTFATAQSIKTLGDLQTYLYTIDKTLLVSEDELNVETMLAKDFTTSVTGKTPKILIFHTHPSEAYINSAEGEVSQTIVGVGNELAKILAEDYNISVVHDLATYDILDGKLDRDGSYERMEVGVSKILAKYPDIEIAIDLHRDGVPDTVHFATDIDGKPTAKIMFVAQAGKQKTPMEATQIKLLDNQFKAQNIALALNMQLTANELYPNLTRKIYLKTKRYSMFMLPKSMLVEVGANTNTIEEAKNAMVPFANIIYKVFENEE